MKSFIVLLTLSFLTVGCSTTLNKSQPNGALDLHVQSKLNADVEVDMNRQVKGSAHQVKLLWFIPIKQSKRFVDGVNFSAQESGFKFFSGGVEDETKAAAAYNAVVPNDVEVLVAPQYTMKVKSYLFGAWKEVTVSVTGYAGKIKGFKKSTK